MNKSVKSIIEILGLIISITGIALFFINQQFVVASLLVLVSVVLIILAIRSYCSHPIKIITVHWNIKILDAEGHETEVQKEKIIVVCEKHITSIFDRHFATAGKIEFLGSNIGKLLSPVDEGGNYAVTTFFTAALEKGKSYEHKIQMKAIDTFPESKETFSCLISEPIKKELSISLSFPQNRKCQECKAFMIFRDHVTEIEPPEVSFGGLNVDKKIPTPKFGAKYFLEWIW